MDEILMLMIMTLEALFEKSKARADWRKEGHRVS